MLTWPRWKLAAPVLACALLCCAFWPEKEGEAAPSREVAVAGLTAANSSSNSPAQSSAEAAAPAAKPAGTVAVESDMFDADPLPKRATLRVVQAKVDALAKWVARKHGTLTVAVLDLDSGKLLAGSNERAALNPASNAKLVTAAVALERLGADYRYTTGVYGRILDGRADRLVLRGHGDPSLSLAQLWDMASTLVEMGLKRVGAIEVDGSRFDAQYVPPAFEQQPDEWASFRAPVSAVALERNTVTLNVVAGKEGQNARIWFDPPGFVEVQGSVSTKASGAGQAVRLSLRPNRSRLVAKVGGSVPEGSPRLRFTRRVDDPSLFPGYVFRHCLLKLGVKVEDVVRRGSGEEKERLVYSASSPLRDLLDELGKDSDNFYAEMILKSLGAELVEEPGKSRDGAAVAIEWLKELRAFPRGTRITNGSGLFDANSLSALSLVKVLDAAYADPAISSEYLSQLATAGTDGTLRSRLRDKATKGRVRAKTGTLAKADALSGYVLPPRSRSAVAFSMVINGIAEHWETRPKMDEVVVALAEHVWR